MHDVPGSSRCARCCYCRDVAGALYCLRNPPVADARTGRARWPRVRPTDTCGAFAETRDPQPDIDNHSAHDAASAPNHQSSIIPHQSPALPIHTDQYGPYCKIPLTQGHFAKVDPAYYPWLAQFRWHAKTGPHAIYAVRTVQHNGRSRRIFMHRMIMNTPDHLVCDHANHDGLDNRIANLRNCTTAQNNANRRKRAAGCGSRAATSQYLGVAYDRRRNKWTAYVKKNGRQKNLGLFDVEEDAARAHDTAARQLHGPYAHLNFPND
ncbi:MAG: AP2/ERF family transcription factor [Planctomycetes bacterium]|nr:AP2/ERF family transcription factor [Planctomycetota bacterium]